ncbi:hypothetical protein KAW18_03760 [candidate division WOR-3 bacterium]|nr:hypothetical protein [candidate division WOR-3 bacterium]
MANVRKYQVTWTKSTSIDVVGYNIYYVPDTEQLNYGSPHVSVGDVNSIIIPDDVPEFPMIDGVYKIGLTAVDDVGNESDIIETAVPFDLVAPDAPADLVVTPL